MMGEESVHNRVHRIEMVSVWCVAALLSSSYPSATAATATVTCPMTPLTRDSSKSTTSNSFRDASSWRLSRDEEPSEPPQGRLAFFAEPYWW